MNSVMKIILLEKYINQLENQIKNNTNWDNIIKNDKEEVWVIKYNEEHIKYQYVYIESNILQNTNFFQDYKKSEIIIRLLDDEKKTILNAIKGHDNIESYRKSFNLMNGFDIQDFKNFIRNIKMVSKISVSNELLKY